MNHNKLSSTLATLLREFLLDGTLNNLATRPQGVYLSTAESLEFSIFVHCEASAVFTDSADIRFHSIRGRIRTARVTFNGLSELSDDPNVYYLSASMRLKTQNDAAAESSGLNVLRQNHPNLKGRGVIVGIIDTGIDAAHRAFAVDRISLIWDQTMNGDGWREKRYGQVLTGADMNQSRDEIGHGTHLAGIAAGADAQFGGVAPEAELIVVKTDFQSANVADAIQFIFDIAAENGRPAVINLAAGAHFDAHDGRDDLALFIEQEVGAGKIVVAAAGNDNLKNINAALTLPVGDNFPTYIKFKILPNQDGIASPRVILRGWYSGNCHIGISNMVGNAIPVQQQKPSPNATEFLAYQNARFFLTTSDVPCFNNNLHEFFIEIQEFAPGNAIPTGSWFVSALNRGTNTAELNIWSWVSPGFKDVSFQTHQNPRLKIGAPGCAKEAVTVASLTTRNRWRDSGGNDREAALTVNTISDFSSPGPLNGENGKPDVTAPGAMIISALSEQMLQPPPERVINDEFIIGSGTSMSAAFITGVCALLLEQDNSMTPDLIKDHFEKISTIPGQPSGNYDEKWGYGYIDVSLL